MVLSALAGLRNHTTSAHGGAHGGGIEEHKPCVHCYYFHLYHPEMSPATLEDTCLDLGTLEFGSDQFVEVDEVHTSGSLMLSLLAFQIPFHLRAQLECNWEQYLPVQYIRSSGQVVTLPGIRFIGLTHPASSLG
jgi:hypothetical protein